MSKVTFIIFILSIIPGCLSWRATISIEPPGEYQVYLDDEYLVKTSETDGFVTVFSGFQLNIKANRMKEHHLSIRKNGKEIAYFVMKKEDAITLHSKERQEEHLQRSIDQINCKCYTGNLDEQGPFLSIEYDITFDMTGKSAIKRKPKKDKNRQDIPGKPKKETPTTEKKTQKYNFTKNETSFLDWFKLTSDKKEMVFDLKASAFISLKAKSHKLDPFYGGEVGVAIDKNLLRLCGSIHRGQAYYDIETIDDFEIKAPDTLYTFGVQISSMKYFERKFFINFGIAVGYETVEFKATYTGVGGPIQIEKDWSSWALLFDLEIGFKIGPIEIFTKLWWIPQSGNVTLAMNFGIGINLGKHTFSS